MEKSENLNMKYQFDTNGALKEIYFGCHPVSIEGTSPCIDAMLCGVEI